MKTMKISFLGSTAVLLAYLSKNSLSDYQSLTLLVGSVVFLGVTAYTFTKTTQREDTIKQFLHMLIQLCVVGASTLICWKVLTTPNIKQSIGTKQEYKEVSVVLDTVTIYNPKEGQCDSEPLVTASRDTIDLRNFPSNWIALSRDLIDSGKFKYGDTVWVEADDPRMCGEKIVKDTQNRRYKNRGDVLVKEGSLGMCFNVKITKL